MSNYLTNGLDISNIIQSGSTISSSYEKFPAYNTSNLAFERHITELGYMVGGIDLCNNIVAYYNDYIGGNWTINNNTYNGNINTNSGSAQNDNQANNATFKAYEAYGNTVTASGTIPNWCTKVRAVVIGAGGGGGGGGANNDTTRAGAGGGGGSGGVAAGTINVVGGQTFNISLGGCGTGGYYQPNSGSAGYNAKAPSSVATTFTYGSSVIQANCGNPGDGGASTSANSNTSATANGGNGTVNTTNVSSYYTTAGSIGNSGNNANPGESSGITNNADLPVLNTNQGDAPNTQTQINQDNQLPGYGQGGWGGWNANTNNGYGGQCGGRSFVRVYFIR